MRVRFIVVVTAMLFGTAAFAQAPLLAHANIINAQGRKIGTAEIMPAVGGAFQVNLTVSHLPPGTHGIHIHAAGKCDVPDFKSAGSHFNPYGKQHGKDNPNGAHAGDLVNFEADANGNAKVTILTTSLTLGDGPNSVFHEGGTALVIHEKADDYKTDPSGNSGNRIACGVLEK